MITVHNRRGLLLLLLLSYCFICAGYLLNNGLELRKNTNNLIESRFSDLNPHNGYNVCLKSFLIVSAEMNIILCVLLFISILE